MALFLQIQFVPSSSWFSWKIAFVWQQLLKSQDLHKCKPPEKVLTVKLGQLESMLEWYPGFIYANTICFWLFLVFLENCVCVTTAVEITGHAQMWAPWKSANSDVRRISTPVNVRMVSRLYFCRYILFLALPGFPGKLRLCNNSCWNCMMYTNVNPLKNCQQWS